MHSRFAIQIACCSAWGQMLQKRPLTLEPLGPLLMARIFGIVDGEGEVRETAHRPVCIRPQRSLGRRLAARAIDDPLAAHAATRLEAASIWLSPVETLLLAAP